MSRSPQAAEGAGSGSSLSAGGHTGPGLALSRAFGTRGTTLASVGADAALRSLRGSRSGLDIGDMAFSPTLHSERDLVLANPAGQPAGPLSSSGIVRMANPQDGQRPFLSPLRTEGDGLALGKADQRHSDGGEDGNATFGNIGIGREDQIGRAHV